MPSATNDQDHHRHIDAIPKLAKQNSTLSNKGAKLQSDEQQRKQSAENRVNAEQEKAPSGKQISKSKSTPSVPTQGQKAGESEKKVRTIELKISPRELLTNLRLFFFFFFNRKGKRKIKLLLARGTRRKLQMSSP